MEEFLVKLASLSRTLFKLLQKPDLVGDGLLAADLLAFEKGELAVLPEPFRRFPSVWNISSTAGADIRIIRTGAILMFDLNTFLRELTNN